VKPEAASSLFALFAAGAFAMPLSPEIVALIDRAAIVPRRLPDDVVTLVGRVIIHWAAIEDELKHILAQAAGVDSSMGRLVLREPGAGAYMALVKQALEARAIEPPEYLGELGKELRAAEEIRNKLAHGTWTDWRDRDGTISHRIHITSGKWPPNRYKTIGMLGATPRKIVRYVPPYEVPEIEKELAEIIRLEGEVHALRMLLISLGPSTGKPRVQSLRRTSRPTSPRSRPQR
jgi:hypothetical protein